MICGFKSRIILEEYVLTAAGRVRDRKGKRITRETGMDQNKRYNIGLELLRAFMCFEVILEHFWDKATIPVYLGLFDELGGVAVPVFMLMSFFLTEPTFVGKDKIKCRKRLWRVAFPQIGWAIIYWVVYKAIYVALQ